MSADSVALVHRWFEEVWNQGKEQTIDELFPPDAVTFGLGEVDAEIRGPAEFKPFFRNIRSAFPNMHITIKDTVHDGNKVAVRFLFEASHLGEGIGIPPTGRQVRVQGMSILETRGGKLIAGWNNWDQLGMLRQVGEIPQPSADRFFEA